MLESFKKNCVFITTFLSNHKSHSNEDTFSKIQNKLDDLDWDEIHHLLSFSRSLSRSQSMWKTTQNRQHHTAHCERLYPFFRLCMTIFIRLMWNTKRSQILTSRVMSNLILRSWINTSRKQYMTHLITAQLWCFTSVSISSDSKTVGMRFSNGLRRLNLSSRYCTHDMNRLSKRHALLNNYRPRTSSSSSRSRRLKNEPNV